ncbi:hypothetical protein H072_5954 [Dactylellina haptotyla CBS 200.50]|uniref:Transmembrane protein UsgS n=1 Tax=Dactylellina haptotyla (strain CBS 200.50) TaxID=1284197 RepID=S8BLF4_DACHA|nr:hypothetical protein H072_5954 [Dactylellina haptotyla CBS 200.50]
MTPEVFKQKAIDSLQSFDPGLVLRGFQLTLVGAYRALQNPNLFRSRHYKQAALAVLAGLILRLVLDLPIFAAKIVLTFSGLFVDLKTASWDDYIITGIRFIERNVLQLPFFLMTLTLRLQSSALDEMFMESLNWVDQTYIKKHSSENPSSLRAPYYQNLVLWEKGARPNEPGGVVKNKKQNEFMVRMAKKGALSLAVYLSSMIPLLGKVVLPAASAFSVHPAVGIGPAVGVFVAGLFVPRKRIVVVLQAYHASRTLMRQLLEPYFARVSYTTAQKKKWFRERQGLLLGFAIGFYLLLKIPLMGVLVYGIAEASTAYLITKITDPPPHPSQGADYAASQAEWRGKAEFLRLDLKDLDEKFGRVIDDAKDGIASARQELKNREATKRASKSSM